MTDGGSKELEAAETEKLRATMQRHPGAQVDFSRTELFSFSTPLEIELRGQDLESMEEAGRQLATLLRDHPPYGDRPEERRVGKEGVRKWRHWWSLYH